ncbi:MAG: hypothetical protein Q9167_005806 [Letrouitia subvulpina]
MDLTSFSALPSSERHQPQQVTAVDHDQNKDHLENRLRQMILANGASDRPMTAAGSSPRPPRRPDTLCSQDSEFSTPVVSKEAVTNSKNGPYLYHAGSKQGYLSNKTSSQTQSLSPPLQFTPKPPRNAHCRKNKRQDQSTQENTTSQTISTSKNSATRSSYLIPENPTHKHHITAAVGQRPSPSELSKFQPLRQDVKTRHGSSHLEHHSPSNVHQSQVQKHRSQGSSFSSDRTHVSHFNRPPVHNRVLYNPNTTHYPSMHAQVSYLDSIVALEVPKAAMGGKESQEKEHLRGVLENICYNAIMEYELPKDPLFDANSIALKAFGSFTTGFATKGSDMDLALLSPGSKPDTASPDSEIPRLLEKALLDSGYGARLLTRTRVPIIRFCEKPTPQLAALLKKERLKWEQERDSAPKLEEKKVENSGDRGGTSENNRSTISTPPKSTESLTAKESHVSSSGGDPTEPKQQRTVEPKERREAVLPDGELVRLYTLAMKEGWFEPAERVIIYKFIRSFNRQSLPTDAASLDDYRAALFSLPDVLNRYRPPPEHHLDFPKSGVGVQCDINFSNRLALHNSALLRCYSLCDPRVKPMVLFVKIWAKKRKINSPYHGTLSSYGYVLMVLHYLINVTSPPILPNLQTAPQAMNNKTPESKITVDGANVRFWHDERAIQRYASSGQMTADHTSSVGSLLRGFFQYFAIGDGGGFSWAQDVLSLRTYGGLLSKKEKDWTAAKTVIIESKVPGQRPQEIRQRYLFAIEDPFEIDHNIARTVVHNGIVAIRDEFRRAHRLIQNAAGGHGQQQDLMAEAEAKDDLNYKYFGPRPRPEQGAKEGKQEQGAKEAKKDKEEQAAQEAKTNKKEDEVMKKYELLRLH